jgi:hypothetical protein
MTGTAVTAVAAIAAVVSYSHLYDLGYSHGQSGTAARLLPLSVDGLILAASLVLLHEARNDHPAPRLARFALWLGIGATVSANLAYGLPYGLIGAVVSAWPGVAFVLSAEILLGSLRRSRGAPEAAPVSATDGVPEAAVVSAPAARTRAARPLSAKASRGRTPNGTPDQIFADELEAGVVPSIRSIRSRCRVGQDAATRIKSELAALIQTAETIG